MRFKMARGFSIAAIGFSLAGCGVTSGSLSDTFGFGTKPTAPANEATEANASVPLTPGVVVPTGPGLLGSEPYDDLTLGKRYLAAGNYGLAERYFRHAVETHARDAEAWLGLAAAYDRLRRFDLADRAYAEAIRLVGPRVAILNNQGYSFMLRGDYKRAREKLYEARAKDPGNRFVENNLHLLAEASVSGKAIE
jgi:tetratricopeptide (TPR) repeat protein